LTRHFDRHLDDDELDKLVSLQVQGVPDSERPPDSGLGEAQRHAESCEDCKRMVQMHRHVQSEISQLGSTDFASSSAGCPKDVDWLQIAAGLLPKVVARGLITHAAQCERCGSLLLMATDALSDEATSEEAEALIKLQTSQRSWQHGLAKKLAGSARLNAQSQLYSYWEQLREWRNFSLGSAALFASTVILIAVFSVLRYHPAANVETPVATVEQNLRLAYSLRRPFKMRLEDSPYPESGTREGERSEKPLPLIDAESVIGHALQDRPEDPVWLALKGRAALFETQDKGFVTAIVLLERAIASDPNNDIARLDLATAYFLRAQDSNNESADYGKAVELLDAVLRRAPNNTVALFNRAIVLEQLMLYRAAVEDWNRYLTIDNSSPWAEEARKELDKLKRELAARHKVSVEPLLSPTDFAKSYESTSLPGIPELDRRAESYLQAAVQSWLPQAFPYRRGYSLDSANSRRALRDLAAMLKKNHQDPWLYDFVHSSSPSSRFARSVRDLADSDLAAEKGQYPAAQKLAKQAADGFRQVSNLAGLLRARYSLVYAEAFMLHYSACLTTGSDLLLTVNQSAYVWLRSQSLLQVGQCQAASAQIQEAILANNQGRDLARLHNYQGVSLRATSFDAEYLILTETPDRAIPELMIGLKTFWNSAVPDVFGYVLYASLEDVFEAEKWWHVQIFAIRESLALPISHSDPIDEAVESELLGDAMIRAGEYPEANDVFQRISVSVLPVERRLEIGIERARTKLLLGRAAEAASDLASLRDQMESEDRSFHQANYFQVYGEALLEIGKNAEAETQFLKTVRLVERALLGLNGERDRLDWSRLQGSLYRDLVRLKLAESRPMEALCWWEWFKGASLRGPPIGNKGLVQITAMSLPAESPYTGADRNTIVNRRAPGSHYGVQPGVRSEPELGATEIAINRLASFPKTVMLSYAVLPSFTVAFTVRDGKVEAHFLKAPADLDDLVTRFAANCASEKSDLGMLADDSRRLYEILVAPVEGDLVGADAVIVETDGSLDRLPLDLLQDRNGRYLFDQYLVTFSPGLSYFAASPRTQASITANSRALVVGASETGDQSFYNLSEIEEEAREVARHFTAPTILIGNEASLSAIRPNLERSEIFHFAGHAVARSKRVGLLVAQGYLLSVGELSRLSLRHTQLVVLSACTTAVGESGAVTDEFSIARFLVSSGVPQVVASRWAVDSGATNRLMRSFYMNLFAGMDSPSALREAVDSLRSSKQYREPYYWAAFAVFGRPKDRPF
jgi:CHAT domain-containing protein/tetratricopeptide (TPR) repeat protein